MQNCSATRRSWTVVAGFCALVVIALFAGRALARPDTTGPEQFTVGGEVVGLYPGALGVLEAHVVNPWDVSIAVTSVVVVASDAGPGCPGTVLHFMPIAGSVDVAARSGAVVVVPVNLDATASDACREAIWPLRFTARAVGDDGVDRTGTGPGQSPSKGPGILAVTGAAIAVSVAVGLALVLLGLVLTRARRRRPAPPGP